MSEAQQVAEATEQQDMAGQAERMYAESPVDTVEYLDTDSGTPEDTTEAEDDGALATDDPDNEDSDTDDGTPDDEESEEGGFEQRYKDLQAEYTQTTQQLADLKAEYAEQVGDITQAKFDLEDKFSEVEQVAEYWNNMALGHLQQLQQINPQTLNQEQYGQWQQQVNAANMQAQRTQQQLAALKDQTQKAKEAAMNREVKVARATLTKSIDNFDEVYPEIGKFAITQGVNPKVFKEITDPGLIKILHGAMQASTAPDAIEEVSRKTQAPKRPARNADGRFKPKPKTLAERMYGEK